MPLKPLGWFLAKPQELHATHRPKPKSQAIVRLQVLPVPSDRHASTVWLGDFL